MMLDTLKTRQRESEWMDDPDADPQQLAKSLRFIRQINAALGYTRSTIAHLDRLVRTHSPNGPITVLDVATGSADVPLAAVRWAQAQRLDLQVVAIDLHPNVARVAAENVGDQIRVVQADARRIPLADAAVDYAMTSMFLHHLDEDAVLQVLREMNRVARRGVIISDLIRTRRAYVWISLFTMLANPMVRHDARVSVRQAFAPDEILALCRQAGLGYLRYHEHFGHRFVLAGERPIQA